MICGAHTKNKDGSMSYKNIEIFLEYLSRLDGRLVYAPVEEESPDIDVALYTPKEIEETSCLYHKILELREDAKDIQCINITYFIDGVQRTQPIWLLRVKDIYIPVHLIRVAAGAMERKSRILYPTEYFVKAEVFALPYAAIRALDPDFPEPPGKKLGHGEPIYEVITREKGPFWTDTSIPLRAISRDLDDKLNKTDLIKTGYVRRKARDRASILMRILELGILTKLRKEKPNEWVLIDGPVAPLFIYSGAVSRDIAGLQDLANKDVAYYYLKRIVGIVKRIRVVPPKLEEALQIKNNVLKIPVYLMSDIIKESMDDPIFRATLVAFINLRYELRKEYIDIWSPLSGLVRIDIPFPAILEDNNEPWYLPDYKPNLDDKKVQDNILRILYTIFKEKIPVPPAYGTRIFTELYPIYETEQWLSAAVTGD